MEHSGDATGGIEGLQRLIKLSPLAMVVTDNLHGNVIMVANAAFSRLTGFAQEDALGRNCRFLSGSGTEREARSELRRAITEERPTVVELTNYRQNGKPFRNAVMLAPVYDDSGSARFFVGSMMDADAGGQLSGLRRSRAGKLVSGLTPRPRQVLELMVAGYRNKDIAVRLGIDVKTVKMHRGRMIRALEVETSAEALRVAFEAGVLVSDFA